MDFALTDDQTSVVELSRRILTDRCRPERLREIEAGADWFDRTTWADLAKADLLGLTLPEADGGGGYGFLEACLLLEEVGRAVAPIPLWSTLVAAQAVAELGSDAQRRRWLPGVIDGSIVLALALGETTADARHPALTATPQGAGWSLTGMKTTVAAAHLAAAALVPARTPDGELLLFAVPADAPGLRTERQDTFSHEPQSHLTFDGVAVSEDDRLGADRDGAAVVGWLVDRATVALCAMAAGVADAGMRLTAAYVTDRKQFDRSIGTFQAVCQRMADCFVDSGAIELTMLQAATRMDATTVESPIDPKLVAVAKYWASYAGSRVGHADLHLHGGISIDLDYPIHRYFLWSKHLEFQLGSATEQLAILGHHLAEEPVAS